MVTFTESAGEPLFDDQVARFSGCATIGKQAIHRGSAWAIENRLVLAQNKVTEKSNEITAIPELLKLLELSGCIVTIDALGCQTSFAQTIVAKDGDYVLALKGNQGTVLEDVTILFEEAKRLTFEMWNIITIARLTKAMSCRNSPVLDNLCPSVSELHSQPRKMGKTKHHCNGFV